MQNKQLHTLSDVLGPIKLREDVLADLRQNQDLFTTFHNFSSENQEKLLRFLCGEKSLEILYDPFFKNIMDPFIHQDRIEGLISAFMGEPVSIKQILPITGTQMVDNGSFVIMDILVELSDHRIIDVEMQKIGYQFPSQRTSCYAADIIMRQYNRVRAIKGKSFSYRDIQQTCLFIFMEHSSHEFLSVSDQFLHHRDISYSSGVQLPETVDITYISLDTFRSTVQNIDTEIAAWLTFLSKDDTESILSLIERYPQFLSCYQDIAAFRQNPEELINMFSEALYILDKNTERLMVDELRAEVEAAKSENQALKSENQSLESKNQALEVEKQSLESKNQSLESEKQSLNDKLSSYEKMFGALPADRQNT